MLLLAGLLGVHALRTVGDAGERACLGVVGHGVVGDRYQLAHKVNGLGQDTVVQGAVVAHDGVAEHWLSLVGEAIAYADHQLCLGLGYHEAGGDSLYVKI